MNIIAYVSDGIVSSIFTTNKVPSDFTDVADRLHIVDATVQPGHLRNDDGSFSAPKPIKKIKPITSVDFLKNLSVDERAALRDKLLKDPSMADAYMLLTAAPVIDLKDQATIDFVDSLKTAAIIPPDKVIGPVKA